MKPKYENYNLIDFSRYTVKEDGIYSNHYKGKKIEGTKVGSPYGKEKRYSQTRLVCKDNKQRYFYVHVALWYYFKGEIPEGLEIDHIISLANGGKNELSNLRLLTHQENMKADRKRN